MPTEWERSSTSPDLGITVDTNTTSALLESKDSIGMDKDMNGEMSTSTGSNSSTNASTNGHNGSSSNGGRKTSLTSPDPTAYVAKARVTRPTPPPPSYNPMQFVQIKPCNLYQTAQQQLKKAEEVKKIKEIQKEEPEEWQNNLDNWKSSRRKRVEHIIDRVVEVKKLELEEHDRSRRKSKTFSEMIEERGERGVRVGRAKLVSLAVYNEDESNDLSDLGIGTSSASGKSSVSEDYENNSVASDNADLEKAILDSNNHPQNSTTREYVSSPGYDTSSSTAPASSPDPCEYTYEGAIQDYKQRVSRATSGGSSGFKLHSNSNNQIKSSSATSKESTPEHTNIDTAPMEAYAARRGCKIEERLIGFEVSSPNDSQDLLEKNKVDLPKIDISKRKEIFECATSNNNINNEVTASNNEPKSHGSSGVPRVTLREHFKLEDAPPASSKKDVKRLSGDITSIKDRLQSLEQQNKLVNPVNSATKALSTKISDTPVPPLKDRLSSLKNAATKEEIKKPPVVLVDARQLQIMRDEEEHAKQRLLSKQMEVPTHTTDNTLEQLLVETKEIELDRDDSGIHTSDDIEEDHISEQKLLQQTQEQQFNEAIAALAIEEQQLEQAANAVNNIEAEFAQLSNASNQVNMVGATTTTTTTTTTAATNEQPCEMEFSVSSTNDLLKTDTVICKSSTSFDSNSASNVDIVPDKVVLGNPATEQTCSLRRKPSNEMVHARNLLKMFKETFNNDIQLDEESEDGAVGSAVSLQTKPLSSPADSKSLTAVYWPPTPTTPTNCSSEKIKTQIFQASDKNVDSSDQVKESNSKTQTQFSTNFNAISPRATSMIPRTIGPTGKPPMSPKLTHAIPQSPLNSPTPSHKPDGQFSINGRVEIFNSKYMPDPTKPIASPPMLPKKSYLPHAISTTCGKSEKFTTGNNKPIMLQSQHSYSPKTTEPLTISNQSLTEANAMSSMPLGASEHQVMRSSNASITSTTTHSPHDQTDIVRCVSPITIVNPDELPKPNTVKALTSCFSNDHSKTTTPSPPIPPKPLPRSRINIALQSPTAEKRNLATAEENQIEQHEAVDKTCAAAAQQFNQLSVISSSSTNSSNSMGTAEPIETIAVVHCPPAQTVDLTSSATQHTPASLPQELITCTPNDSTLYKLACSSTPSSPVSPGSPNRTKICQNDIDFCKNFFSTSPLCEIPAQHTSPMRQQTVEELPCSKINVQDLSPNSHVPCTAWFEITPDQVKRCDNQNSSTAPSTPIKSIRDEKFEFANSKPNSPIVAARAAHSKALIETCEKIIAEERQARSHINSSLPNTPTSQKSTPILGRKSKIPKPIQCCISGSDSMTKADLKKSPTAEQEKDEDGMLIARLHVVETQIKVTTTTPPTSPKANTRNKAHAQNNNQKPKTKNIFDFLKRNFGHNTTNEPIDDVSGPTSARRADAEDTTTYDEIITVDNSKFYIPTEETSPPPLPLTPAPVSIEITKKITTDEILEESNSELALSQEINTMLDDEFTKLSLASVELEREPESSKLN